MREDVFQQSLALRQTGLRELADELSRRRDQLDAPRRLHRAGRSVALGLEALARRRLLRLGRARSFPSRPCARTLRRPGFRRRSVSGRACSRALSRSRRRRRLVDRRNRLPRRLPRRLAAAVASRRARRLSAFGARRRALAGRPTPLVERCARAVARARRLACRDAPCARALWARARQVREHAAAVRRCPVDVLAALDVAHRHIIA